MVDLPPNPHRSAPHGPASRPGLAVVGVALGVLVVTAALARRGVSGTEAAVFAAVNGLPAWLHLPVWPVMQLGNVLGATTVALVAAATTRRVSTIVTAGIAPVLAWLAAVQIKGIVGRGRPFDEGVTTVVRGIRESGLGFVSGHAAVSFALATVTAALLRGRWRALPYGLATVVACSRLYVGAHLPLDVLGGAACGIVIGATCRVADRWWQQRS